MGRRAAAGQALKQSGQREWLIVQRTAGVFLPMPLVRIYSWVLTVSIVFGASLVAPQAAESASAVSGRSIPVHPPSTVEFDDGMPLPATHPRGNDAPISVRFRWPLLKQDFQHSFNYVDLDPSGSVNDWSCKATTYDTHQGNDIMIRDFVEMDEGRFIVAAAPGVVLRAVDGYFDRAAFPGNGGPNNFVYVQHDDGSKGLYLHHAKWSSLVGAGERFFEGQPLALVGSAGNSSDPHVHFEVADADGTTQEPFAGACRAGASLWQPPQPAHVTTNPIDVYSAGIQIFTPDIYTIKERYPDVTRVQQNAAANAFFFWHRNTDIHAGDVSRVVYRRPDNSIFSDDSFTYTTGSAYDWMYWQTFLPGSGSLGAWKIEYYLNGVLKLTKNFTLSAAAFANPVANTATFAVPKGVAGGVLKGSDVDSGVKNFTLVTPPAHGEVRLFGPRQSRFRYVPESGYAGSDSFQVRATDSEFRDSANASISLNVTAAKQNVLRLEGDSEQDYIEVPAAAALDTPGNAFTVETWIRPGVGSNQYQRVIDRRSPTEFDLRGVSFRLPPEQWVEFSLGRGSDAAYCYSIAQLPLTRWTHVALSYDGTYQRVYINGVLDNFCFAPGSISWTGTGALRIGGGFGSFETYRGDIDEVRWWATARSAAEIASGASCSFYSAALPATLRGNWRFNGDALDSTANALHGTRVVGASFALTDGGTPLRCAGVNLDGDAFTDNADNCPLVSQPSQADADGDKVGDACDLCPAVRDAAQADLDLDGVGDACDKCPFVVDSDQADSDGDGAGDACDPFGSDASKSVPSAAITLNATHNRVSGVSTFSWTAEPKSTAYEFYRGTQPMVAARFYGTCQNARDGNTVDTQFAESEAPVAGSAYFYLVIGVAADGTRGLAGVDSGGKLRDLRARDCR